MTTKDFEEKVCSYNEIMAAFYEKKGCHRDAIFASFR